MKKNIGRIALVVILIVSVLGLAQSASQAAPVPPKGCGVKVITPGNIDFSETRTRGSNTFLADGLHIKTEAAPAVPESPDQRKAAGYIPVNQTLASIPNASLDYTVITNQFGPGLQIVIDHAPYGSPDGILVGEDYLSPVWWATNSSSATVKAAAPSGGAPGPANTPYYGTLAQWISALPGAKVLAVGYSLGSGVTGEGVINSLTFGCTEYQFSTSFTDWVQAQPEDSGEIISQAARNR